MFHIIAWISLAIAFVCAIVIALDVFKHPQKMWIMNIVWPVTALYFSVFAVWGYFKYGRKSTKQAEARKEATGQSQQENKDAPPGWSQVAIAVSHCGAGCTLADIVADTAVFLIGFTIAGSDLFGTYVVDYVAAWTLGVAFQYFTIVPMRGLSPLKGIGAAMKADTLSITAFQIGMYGFMALVYFVLFPHPHLQPNEAEYWCLMQIAMICGFATAYPMNYLLIRMGWKEKMG